MTTSWDEACLLTNNHLQDPSTLILSIVCGYLVVGAFRLVWQRNQLLLSKLLGVRIW